jgi:hypothetical protein
LPKIGINCPISERAVAKFRSETPVVITRDQRAEDGLDHSAEHRAAIALTFTRAGD